ncbi:ABC-2 family transporter protein [Metalysinibacillus saudimassiliensis]|uniref:ABC-2 family transporter protein n=1 Tax=Metalysinibacillus saudimassiliensis TaxID=1461583 RepID=A0A078M9Q0_9BACL|nr:ABC-2 family transporter protein [Metalysinibacillus saudimassiliensis]
MREFWIIFKQAFMTKAKTKSFVITTIIMMLGIVLMTNITTIIDKVSDLTGSGEADTLTLLVADDALYQNIAQHLDDKSYDFTIKRAKKDEQALIDEVKKEKLDAFAKVELTTDEQLVATYQTSSMMDDKGAMLQEILQAIQTEKQAEKLSLTQTEVQTLFAPVQFEEKNISASAKSEAELGQARVLVYVLMFLIYFAVILYSGMIATEVATEKSSRVMEILISSVSPVKHMFAKVIGIGMLGIVQMILLGLTGFIAVRTSSATGDIGEFIKFSDVNPMTLVYGAIFFLLGYFLYATLAALLGSLVSRIEDVQQMIMPMTILIVIAFIIAMTGLGNPELAYLKWASYFPFFTPLVMFMRVGLLDLPMWEPLLAIAIMLITIGVLGWFGARVYRGGVLMYGPSRSLKDIKKAVQLGKE